MHVANRFAHLQELLVGVDGELVLAKVVVEDTCGVVGSALVSGFASSAASECQDVVVFEAFLSCDAVVGIGVTHLQASRLGKHLLVQFLGPDQLKEKVRSVQKCM